MRCSATERDAPRATQIAKVKEMPFSSPELSYWICTSPRSGSEALTELLTATKLAGVPREYFGRSFRSRYESVKGPVVNYPGYIANIVELGMTPNRVFGAKVFWFHFLKIFPNFKKHWSEDYSFIQLLNFLWPGLKIVRLRRADKLRQAISYYRATTTGVWRSTDKRAPYADCPFNFTEIQAMKDKLTAWEYYWHTCFKSIGVVPYEILYEDMVQDFHGTLESLLDYLSIDYSDMPKMPKLSLSKQADDITERWVELYHREKSSAG